MDQRLEEIADARKEHRLGWANGLAEPHRSAWLDFYSRFYRTEEADRLLMAYAARVLEAQEGFESRTP